MSRKAISYLRSIEWQDSYCSCCLGANPYEEQWVERVGHLRSCRLAQALAELGQPVEWSRRNKSTTHDQFKQFEKYLLRKKPGLPSKRPRRRARTS